MNTLYPCCLVATYGEHLANVLLGKCSTKFLAKTLEETQNIFDDEVE